GAWRCRTGAAGDCPGPRAGGCRFHRKGSTAVLDDRRRLTLESGAARGPSRVEPAVFPPVDRDLDDGLAVLRAAQLGRPCQAVAQPLPQLVPQLRGAVVDGDSHDVRMYAHAVTATGASGRRRGGSIMCQRGTRSLGRMNSKSWPKQRIRSTFPPSTAAPVDRQLSYSTSSSHCRSSDACISAFS